jgi:uncharacterized metal-binding protein YceD (DUF177 family)
VSGPALEFSRPVPLTRLGAEPFRQEIAASEAERAALARRFGLVSLARLNAAVELVREPGGTVLLTAELAGEFVQVCVATLEPVDGSVEAGFALRYGPAEAEPEAGGDDDPAFEPLSGETIDIGEAVAQEFSLSLPPFPRVPDAVVEADPEEPDGDGPFSGLAQLAGRKPD